SFQYTAHDNGGTSNGGIDTSAAATATINVTSVNDAPVAATVSTSGLEDASSISVTLSGTDPNDSPANTIDSFTLSSLPSNGALYTDAAHTTLAVSGTAYTATAGQLTLYFVPAANFNG